MYLVIGKDNCPFCDRAKAMLEGNNLPMIYININNEEPEVQGFLKGLIKKELTETTVPQIFTHIGGAKELEYLLKISNKIVDQGGFNND